MYNDEKRGAGLQPDSPDTISLYRHCYRLGQMLYIRRAGCPLQIGLQAEEIPAGRKKKRNKSLCRKQYSEHNEPSQILYRKVLFNLGGYKHTQKICKKTPEPEFQKKSAGARKSTQYSHAEKTDKKTHKTL